VREFAIEGGDVDGDALGVAGGEAGIVALPGLVAVVVEVVAYSVDAALVGDRAVAGERVSPPLRVDVPSFSGTIAHARIGGAARDVLHRNQA